MFSVKIRDEDKIGRCGLFVVPGESAALLRMPDIKLLGILNVMCDVIEDQQDDSRFTSQTIEPYSAKSLKTNRDIDCMSDNENTVNSYSNMPDYFRSGSNREAEKRPAN